MFIHLFWFFWIKLPNSLVAVIIMGSDLSELAELADLADSYADVMQVIGLLGQPIYHLTTLLFVSLSHRRFHDTIC